MSDWREEQRRQDQIRREEVMHLPVLPVRWQGSVGGRDGDVRVCASAGPAGEVVTVWTAAGDREAVTARTVAANGVSAADPGTGQPVAARITVHAPGLEAVIQLQQLTLAHIMVQPMPGGRFLVAGARCQWRPEGPEPNTVLYDTDGQIVSEHVLGDGIGQLLASRTGQVWAGYFDEGIYGSYGWGRPDGDDPAGAYGLVRFSPALEPQWHLPRYTEIGPWEAIGDCPALNVSDTDTWACYDSDYPLVRIREDQVTGWHNDIKGPAAFAVAGTRVALAGGSRPDHDRLALTELSTVRAELAGEYRLVLPSGQPLPPGTKIIGRGSRLHFLAGTSWYRLDVDDVPG